MPRVSNFTAGPAALPLPVLETAQRELLDYAGTGMSIMECSHRSKTYEAVHTEALSLVRELLAVPDDYQVLFLQGGASLQFAQVPMNLLQPGRSADYLVTGHWSERALEEAQLVGQARAAVSTREPSGSYTRIPRQEELALDPNAAYVHMTTNNTMFGTQWATEPSVGAVPLVADASSDILSRPLDVSKYGLLYAGAQKNIGPSGVTLVIVRQALLDGARTDLPVILRYATHAKNNSLFHTPPSFGVYLVREVLRWLKTEGGLVEIARRNETKAARLYGALDAAPDYFRAPVERASRSRMNVVFRLPTEALEDRFVKEAERRGLIGLRGHRLTGGIRASLYNAVSLGDVDALTGFMDDFRRQNPA